MIRIDIFVVFYSLYIKLYSRAKKLLEEIFKIIFNLAVDVEVINANVGPASLLRYFNSQANMCKRWRVNILFYVLTNNVHFLFPCVCQSMVHSYCNYSNSFKCGKNIDVCSTFWSNFRIPRNSFTCHWIRIASIVLCLDLQSLPTHVSEADQSCGVFWRLAHILRSSVIYGIYNKTDT